MPTTRPLAAITGASAGIGATFARTLAARGHDLILIARRKDRLETLATDLEKRHGAKSEIIAADLNQADDLDRVARHLSALPDLALLVNNAGYGVAGLFARSDYPAQAGMHLLHVMATLRLTHAVLAGMVARRSGAIVNVASVAGFLPAPGSVSYGSSKCWINAFTEGIWMELRGSGSPVRVQALCPGFTYSEFHDVAGMNRDRLAPKSWWCPAEQVVEESLDGLDRDRVFVIPGLRYRMLVRVAMAIPRALRRRLLMAMSRRNGRLARQQ
ncbi:MAG TPA: SDR family oxidoreductase [Bryobacteraceae bacterium]|nr:SDR family oxidoreductase [Bryobacteraceae bacterium]